MWSTEKQRNEVCKLFLERCSLGPMMLWTAEGPLAKAHAWKAHPKKMPGVCHSAFILWRLAWDIYNGTGKFSLAEALATLDGPNLHAVGSFLVAFAEGELAVEEWCCAQDEMLRKRYAAVARPPLRSV